MADGFSSGAGSCRAAVALTFRSAGRAPAKNADPKVGATLAWPRRQNRVAVEEPPTIKIGGLESERCATSFLACFPMQ